MHISVTHEGHALQYPIQEAIGSPCCESSPPKVERSDTQQLPSNIAWVYFLPAATLAHLADSRSTFVGGGPRESTPGSTAQQYAHLFLEEAVD